MALQIKYLPADARRGARFVVRDNMGKMAIIPRRFDLDPEEQVRKIATVWLVARPNIRRAKPDVWIVTEGRL